MNKVKVFGIGLSRTGTKSLKEAFCFLGYNFYHQPRESILFQGNYDGASDVSVTRRYKTLDKKFPNSKFILTVREKDDWLASMETHWLKTGTKETDRSKFSRDNRIAVYGQLTFDKEVFSVKYDQHITDVKQYFKNRPNDLLIMNICGGEEWKKLIPFLNTFHQVCIWPAVPKQNEEILQMPFPGRKKDEL